jgi:hypothetical protein
MIARGRGRLLLIALLVAAFLFPASAGLAIAPTTGPPAHLTAASDYADLSAAGARILFGAALPQVEILPNSNTSMAATLSIVYLLELAPNVSDPVHPRVVGVASPESLQHFNSSISVNDGIANLSLTAALPVFASNSSLWSNGTAVPASTASSNRSILSVSYSQVTGQDGSPGVLVSWTVAGWPWVNASRDQLALEYVVQLVSGSGFQTCSGAPGTAGALPSACPSQSLATAQPVWGSSLTALKGTGPGSWVAWVGWNSSVTTSENSSKELTAGAYLEEPGTSALVLTAPVDGAPSVSGATVFLLSPGSLAGVPTLRGNAMAYGGAAALFGSGIATAIVVVRRRDRAIARELAA